MPAVPCASYTCDLCMACDVYMYDGCAAESGRVPYVGAQYVVHRSWVYDAMNTPGVHQRCMVYVVCVRVCMRAAASRRVSDARAVH
eukprot:7831445-Pyramimonas_sp.AAC.1